MEKLLLTLWFFADLLTFYFIFRYLFYRRPIARPLWGKCANTYRSLKLKAMVWWRERYL